MAIDYANAVFSKAVSLGLRVIFYFLDFQDTDIFHKNISNLRVLKKDLNEALNIGTTESVLRGLNLYRSDGSLDYDTAKQSGPFTADVFNRSNLERDYRIESVYIGGARRTCVVAYVAMGEFTLKAIVAKEETWYPKAEFIPAIKYGRISFKDIADSIASNSNLKCVFSDKSEYPFSDRSPSISYSISEIILPQTGEYLKDGQSCTNSKVTEANIHFETNGYTIYFTAEFIDDINAASAKIDDTLIITRIDIKYSHSRGNILHFFDGSGKEALKITEEKEIDKVCVDNARIGEYPTVKDAYDSENNNGVLMTFKTKYGPTFQQRFYVAYAGILDLANNEISKESLVPYDSISEEPFPESRRYVFLSGMSKRNPLDLLGDVIFHYKTIFYTIHSDGTVEKIVGSYFTFKSYLNNVKAVYDGSSHDQIDPADFQDGNVKQVDIQYEYNTERGYYLIHGHYLMFVSLLQKTGIEVSGTDSTKYYLASNNIFNAPEGVRFLWRYNNGTTKEMTEDEISSLEYTETVSKNKLIPNQTSNFYSEKPTLSITVSILEGGKTYTGTYNANFIRDRITALEILTQDPLPKFYLGNKPSYFSKIGRIKATFASLGEDGNPRVDDNFRSYELQNSEKSVMEASALANLNLKILNSDVEDGVSLSLSTDGKLEFVKPELIKDRCTLTSFPTKYINRVSRINFKGNNVKVNLVYGHKKADGTYEEASDYEEAVPYDDRRCTVTVWHNLDEDQQMDIALDGGADSLTSVDMGKDMFFDCFFRFVVTDIFDTSKSITIEQPFQIVAITGIKAISIDRSTMTFSNGKSLNYTIGQKFLYPDDDGTPLKDNTTANIYYQNEAVSDTSMLSYQARLDSGLEALRIDPAPGTVFNKIGNQTIRVSSIFDSSIYAEYTIKVSPRDFKDDTETDEIKAVWFPFSSVPNDLKDMDGNAVTLPSFQRGIFLLLPASAVEKNGHNVAKPSWDERAYGYLLNVFDKTKNAKVVLFQDYFPPVMGESNITVKFPVWVDGNADLINRCTFGHLFGNNNAKNRLFVSGNPDHINRDWHTGATEDDTNGDFSYFADTSWQDYGQTDNKVIGYDIVSTDKMVVLKTKSYKEPSVYYRTSTLLTALDASGAAVKGVDGSTLAQEAYPLSIGNIGPGAYNPQGITNLNGDTLFISGDNVIAGLDVDGQIGDSLRAANTRSFYIDTDLKGRDMSNATIWSNGSQLWLVLPECVYFTDYRTINSDTRQYEWFKEDLKGISCFGNIDGRMVFGKEDGSLCYLEGDSYSDEDVIYPKEGQMTVFPSTEKITVDNEIIEKLKDHETYGLDIEDSNDGEAGVYQVVCKVSAWYDGDNKAPVNFTMDNKGLVMNTQNTLYQETIAKISKVLGIESEVYLKDIVQTTEGKLKPNHPYRLVLDEKLEDSSDVVTYPYRLYDGATDVVSFEGVSSFTLVKRVIGRISFETTSDENGLINPKVYNGSNLRIVDENGDPIDIENAAGYESVPITSPILLGNTVKAYYVTAPNTLGNLGYSKTVWSMTMTAEPAKENDLKVGIATNKKQVDRVIELTSGRQGEELDYANLDFNKLYLGKSVIPGKYTVYRPIYPLPFVCLGFSSDKDMPSRLTPFQYTYSTSGPSFGQGGNI